MHGLLATPEKTRWWKDNNYDVGGGYMAKAKPCHYHTQVAGYMTKYMAKQMALNRWPKSYRRIRTSRNWPVLKKQRITEGLDYVPILHQQAEATVQALWDEGYDVCYNWSEKQVEALDFYRLIGE